MEVGEYFPPVEDEIRIQNYIKYRELFRGNHGDVFADVQKRLEGKSVITYIAANFCGIIAKLSGDLLFGEPIKITGENQKKIDEIVEMNKLNSNLLFDSISNAYKGDSFWKIRYNERIIIEPVRPEIVFVDLDEDNILEPIKYSIAWIKHYNDNDYVRVEEHEKGLIRNKLFSLKKGKLKEQIDIHFFYPELEEEQKTGIDDFLIVHIPNFRTNDSFWGISDYYDIEPVQDEINNRLSRISMILDKHSDPTLIVPTGTLDENGELRKGDAEVFEIGQGDLAPQYLTWNGNIDSAFKEIDLLIDTLHMMAEISPSLTGLDRSGIPESGRALKYRLLRTLAKIGRKRIFYDEGIKKIINLALQMEGVEPFPISIKWSDGIPDDYSEKIIDEANRISSGTTSVVSAIKRIDNCDDEMANSEYEKIKQETLAQSPPIGLSKLEI